MAPTPKNTEKNEKKPSISKKSAGAVGKSPRLARRNPSIVVANPRITGKVGDGRYTADWIAEKEERVKGRDRDTWYQVKWSGYDLESNTWQSEGSLEDCKHLIAAFEFEIYQEDGGQLSFAEFCKTNDRFAGTPASILRDVKNRKAAYQNVFEDPSRRVCADCRQLEHSASDRSEPDTEADPSAENKQEPPGIKYY